MTVAASLRRQIEPARLVRLADGLAVAVAVSIPWYTSVTSLCVVAWLVVCLPTLRLSALRAELARPAGGTAALLAGFGLLATLWAEVPWAERLGGMDSFARLLLLPILLAHFRGSQRGRPVLAGFLVSCTVLLVLSWMLAFWPWMGRGWVSELRIYFATPMKDYIAQSGEFVLCTFALAPVVVAALRARRWLMAGALGSLALAFLANVLYIATGRTTLVVILVLVVLVCVREFSWKGAVAALLAAVIVGLTIWWSSPYLRARVESLVAEITTYLDSNATTSAGERLEYWKKSIRFIAEAPILGHGTGTIRALFRRSVAGESGPGAEISSNPHNQTFTVALQAGLVGTALLFAMWLAHLMLFRGPRRLAAWIGLVIVVENIVGSLFNSHLFDFTQAWIYIFGVGAAGGMLLPRIAADPQPSPALGAARGAA